MSGKPGLLGGYDPIRIAESLEPLGKTDQRVSISPDVAIDHRNSVFPGTNDLIKVIGNRTSLSAKAFAASRGVLRPLALHACLRHLGLGRRPGGRRSSQKR
ncbi:hypothetical protein AB0A81_31400 [Streptomyces flaveolus]|uniref:Uncharacterized protein n=1 Tax=Streptomyces flaveolus TaxID=67297 RepID=A0ABV1VJB2_9ACTN